MTDISKNMNNNLRKGQANSRKERMRRELFEEFHIVTELSRMARVHYLRLVLDATGAGRKATTMAASFKKIYEVDAELIDEAMSNINALLTILERCAALKATIVKTWTDHLASLDKVDTKSLTQLNITNTTTLPFTKPIMTIDAEIVEIQKELKSAQKAMNKKST